MNSGTLSDCISLNDSVKSISRSPDSRAFACRVGYRNRATFTNNYANKNMVMQIGSSESNMSNVVAFGENHGDNLKAQPLALLNAWVTANTTTETPYQAWSVVEGVNNGNPVFANMLTVRVSFESNQGTAVAPVTVKYGELLTAPEAPTLEGYDFMGWYKDEECTQAWDFDTDKVYSDIILYAKWSIIYYETTFESNQGSIVDPFHVKYGELLPKLADPVREGYDFAGWHKDQELTQLWDFDNDRVYSNTTLYAKWNSATSIEDMNSDGTIVYSGSRCIVVKNAITPITVYSISGATVRTIQQPSEMESIDIEPGYYIVRIGEKSTKVMVY